jgi:uncharacterized membrane protein
VNTHSHPNLKPLYMTRSLMRHWLLIFITLYGLFNLLPFFAPVLMKIGWSGGGNAIYAFYSTLCHQMAQRSFFLFGEHSTYTLDQLPVTLSGHTGPDTLLLRSFRGNDVLGWKVAWSDRMISLYTGVWLVGIVYWGVSRFRPQKPISIWRFGLLALPMVIDGGTHMISDMTAGLTRGFRYQNAWLVSLTGNVMPETFYVGDALGSFNSWTRLLTGLLFAAGAVWLTFPLMDRYTRSTLAEIDAKIERVNDAQRRLSAHREQLLNHVQHLGRQDS